MVLLLFYSSCVQPWHPQPLPSCPEEEKMLPRINGRRAALIFHQAPKCTHCPSVTSINLLIEKKPQSNWPSGWHYCAHHSTHHTALVSSQIPAWMLGKRRKLQLPSLCQPPLLSVSGRVHAQLCCLLSTLWAEHGVSLRSKWLELPAESIILNSTEPPSEGCAVLRVEFSTRPPGWEPERKGLVFWEPTVNQEVRRGIEPNESRW